MLLGQAQLPLACSTYGIIAAAEAHAIIQAQFILEEAGDAVTTRDSQPRTFATGWSNILLIATALHRHKILRPI